MASSRSEIRKHVLLRDKACQFPTGVENSEFNICGETHKLLVHKIKPTAWSMVEHLDRSMMWDFPEVTLTFTELLKILQEIRSNPKKVEHYEEIFLMH